jgi:hypothetical protein
MRSLEGAFLLIATMALAVVTSVWLLVVFNINGSGAATVALVIAVLSTAGLVGVIAWAAHAGAIRTEDGAGEKFSITRAGMEQVVARAGAEVPGVDSLESAIRGGSRGIDIECVALTSPPFNPLDVRRRLRSHLRQQVPALTGIPVGRVAIAFEGLPTPDFDDYP